MQKIILYVLIILTLTPVAGITQSTKISLKKGQKYKVETSTKMTSSAEVMGDTIENNMESKSTMIYEIINTGKKTVDLRSTFTKIKVTSTIVGQEYNYDSDKKDNAGPMSETLSNMINKPKNITINSKGDISRQDEDSVAVLDGILSSNTFTTELFIPALIGKKLEPEDSFTDITTKNKDKYSKRDSGTYRVSTVRDAVATISYNGTQVINTIMKQMGMEMTSSSNNKVVAMIQVDILTGLVLVKASVTDSNTSIEAAGMTISSTGKTTTTITISPVK